jgi:hypothetical protein
MDQIETLLRDLSLTRYLDCFRDNHIDGGLLADLTSADLREIGPGSLGHRKRILRAGGTFAPGEACARRGWRGGAAARGVKAFADLADYTRLMRELTASWRCSARRSPMATTPSGRSGPQSPCTAPCATLAQARAGAVGAYRHRRRTGALCTTRKYMNMAPLRVAQDEAYGAAIV